MNERTEIISNEYQNGSRVCTQRVTYTKSEDLYMLANLQRQLEMLTNDLQNATDEQQIAHLRVRLEACERDLQIQWDYVNGYGDE